MSRFVALMKDGRQVGDQYHRRLRRQERPPPLGAAEARRAPNGSRVPHRFGSRRAPSSSRCRSFRQVASPGPGAEWRGSRFRETPGSTGSGDAGDWSTLLQTLERSFKRVRNSREDSIRLGTARDSHSCSMVFPAAAPNRSRCPLLPRRVSLPESHARATLRARPQASGAARRQVVRRRAFAHGSRAAFRVHRFFEGHRQMTGTLGPSSTEIIPEPGQCTAISVDMAPAPAPAPAPDDAGRWRPMAATRKPQSVTSMSHS